MAEPIFRQIGSVVSTAISAIGDPTTLFSSVNEAKIRYNENTSTWQFSNDGTEFRDFSSGTGIVYNLISANSTLEVDNGYIVETATNALTLTLPAGPSVGAQVKIIDTDGNASTNNITIGRNGSNIMGVAEDMTISTDNANIILVYINTSKGWVIG